MNENRSTELSRREFLKYSAVAGGVLGSRTDGGKVMASPTGRVAFVKTDDRKRGVQASLSGLNINPSREKTF